jgi:hypothetical protein
MIVHLSSMMDKNLSSSIFIHMNIPKNVFKSYLDIDIYGAFHYIISYTSKNKYNTMHYLLFNERQIYDHIEFHIFVYYWNDIHCDNIFFVFVIKFHTHYGTMHINLTTLFVDPNVHLPPFTAPFQGLWGQRDGLRSFFYNKHA